MIGPDIILRLADYRADPAEMAWHHKQHWIERMTELRRAVREAPDEEARAQAKRAVTDHYREETNVEPTRAAMMHAEAAKVPDGPGPEELKRIAREAVEGWRAANSKAAARGAIPARCGGNPGLRPTRSGDAGHEKFAPNGRPRCPPTPGPRGQACGPARWMRHPIGLR